MAFEELRRRASSFLSPNKPVGESSIEKLNAEETKKLLHELRVHQIELRLQNEELQEANIQLAQARSLFFEIFDAAPMPYFQIDCKSLIVDLNAVALELTSCSRDIILGQPFIKFLDQPERPKFHKYLQEVFQLSRLHKQEFQFIPWNYAKSKSKPKSIPVEISSRVLKSHGKPFVLSLVTDLSLQKELQAGLLEERQSAEQANMLKTQFLGNISHEVRTPISVVMNYTDLLLEDVTDETTLEKLRIISTASNNLLELINEILDLSRIEQGVLSLEPKTFSLIEFLNYLETMYSLQAVQEKLEFDFVRETKFPERVIGDEKRIRQIATNMLNNAIKFTPAHGKVTVSCAYRKAHFVFSVKDTGPGISSENQGLIFGAFQQVQTTKGNTNGVGLGLAISRRLIELMGGLLKVKSELGAGATFLAQIPLQSTEKDNDLSVSTKSFLLNDSHFSSDSSKVLIVEDNELLQQITGIVVKRLGLKYEMANNGIEALERIQQDAFGVVLLDLNMPVMDGYETIERIRSQEQFSHLPVIALTAQAFELDYDRCIEAGFTDYLTKPIKFDRFTKLMKEHLKARPTP